ncbi:MAG: porin [Deltaproteobacteria bacterium]|nr:porin [Deltaproteobacteria bacterium]
MKMSSAVLLAILVFGAECAADGPPSLSQLPVPKVSGYVESWFYSDSSDLSSQTSAKKVDNGFRVRRARLAASGEIGEGLAYKVGAGLDGPANGAASSTVRLLDAWMEYKANDALRAAIGQFKYEFTLEGAESTPDRLPVLRSEVTNELSGKLGTVGGTFRDIGIKVSGAVKKAKGLRYSAAVINGNGMNLTDNNGYKDIVGRITVEPLSGLVVGASGYKGRSGNEGDAFDVDESAWGVEAQYAVKGVKFRAEYVAARWENWGAATSAASLSKIQEPWGWYAQGSYRLPFFEKVEVLGRYEYFEKDSNTVDSGLEVTTVGATYYLKGKTRITANYLFREPGQSNIITAQETNATGAAISDLFLLQALISF